MQISLMIQKQLIFIFFQYSFTVYLNYSINHDFYRVGRKRFNTHFELVKLQLTEMPCDAILSRDKLIQCQTAIKSVEQYLITKYFVIRFSVKLFYKQKFVHVLY